MSSSSQPPHEPNRPPGSPGAKQVVVGGLPWQTPAVAAPPAGPAGPSGPPAAAAPPVVPFVPPAPSPPPPVVPPAAASPLPAVPMPPVVPGAAPAAQDVAPIVVVDRPPRGARAPRPRAPVPPVADHWLARTLGDEAAAAEILSLPQQLRARLAAWFRESPPLTASLCLHLVVLLALAAWIVRDTRQRRSVLDLSFASPEVVEAPDPGVQIVDVPEEEDEPVPEPEVVKVEEPPVEDPAAAPPMVEEPVADASGAAAEASAAPAIGTLLDGREVGRRAALVKAFGGSDATEAAVARGLEWLARQQGKDGLWSLQGPYGDGASQENRLAATAMALLAFQGAGNTPREGIHKRAVASAWKALLAKQVPGGDGETVEARRRSGAGRFEISLQDPPERQALYAHGQVVIALCEIYGMTKDPAFEQPARRAVAYAVAAQGPNGGWRYEPGQPGDMSVTGWYMMGLKSAQMAGLDVPEKTLTALESFLDGAAVEGGSRYGYRFDDITRAEDAADAELVRSTAGPVTDAVSAEGLLCRQYLGWPRDHPALAAGVERLVQDKFLNWEDDKDVYAWYYITQVVHHLGGPAWDRWNGRMKEVLLAEQVRNGREAGSWDPGLDKWGPWGGRLFMTCFCTYMLEVYYRHLPIYGDEALATAAAP